MEEIIVVNGWIGWLGILVIFLSGVFLGFISIYAFASIIVNSRNQRRSDLLDDK